MASLGIPPSDSVVRLRAIDAKTSMSLHSYRFFEPSLPGFETLNLTSVCYLVDNVKLKKTILFDCGARKDFENYSPAFKSRMNSIVQGLKIEADVNDILVDAGIELQSVDSIVWSHWHWDHIGAAQKFPNEVDIVVGPGFKDSFMPGYPTKLDAPLLDADFQDRTIHEISFTDSPQDIGGFRAFDFFGDGSFYLLDSPGHAIGHMCSLARTTPDTFVFLGGDICHYAGMFRPGEQAPLPDPIPAGQLEHWFPSPCPCSLFTDHHPLVTSGSEAAKFSPFFHVTSVQPSSYQDRNVAMKSIRAMQDFDGSPDVLVCIAHDPTLLKVLPLLNDDPERDLNDWKAKGFKEKLQWVWLNDLPRNGAPGRPMLVEGEWRGSEWVDDFEKLPRTR